MPTIRRAVYVAGEKVARTDLSEMLDLTDLRARSLLTPIAEEWLKGRDRREYTTPAGFRLALINHVTDTWREEFKGSHPALASFLSATQLNTIMYMSKLTHHFDGVRLEGAVKAVTSAKHVDQKTIRQAFGPGKLPPETPSWNVFTTDWSAKIPGTEGLAGELESAAQVDPTTLQKGQLVRLSSDFDLGGVIGGQTTQDADVSFVDSQGNKVLAEVADSVARLRAKIGPTGSAQRQRYSRLQQRDPSVVLAYSSPRAAWHEFFTGDAGSSVAEALVALDPPWGLMIAGQWVAPDQLASVTATIQEAAPKVKGFEQALLASGLTWAAVRAMSAKELSDRLQRNARRQ